MKLECSTKLLRNVWLTFHSIKRKVSKWNKNGLISATRSVMRIILTAPIYSFFYCLYVAYTIPNQHGMYTHCGVSNFALSVSEAIAKPQRSRIVWTIAIAIHAPIKLYYSFELAKFYVDYLYNRNKVQLKDGKANHSSINQRNVWRLCLFLAMSTGIIELGSLIGLTLITSHNVDYFYIHQACVGGFLFGGASHMVLSSYIENVCSKKVIRISQKRSIYYNQKHLFFANWRRRISILVCVDAALMFYLYYRHNRYCEPYMYSMFCLSEYLVIVLNMIYHNMGPSLLNQHRWQKSSPCWAGHHSIEYSIDNLKEIESRSLVDSENDQFDNSRQSDGTALV